MDRICENQKCGKDISHLPKNSGTKNGVKQIRKFCSRSCAAQVNNVKFPKRKRTYGEFTCLYCKKTDIRNHYGQKYCSSQCSADYHKPNWGEWLDGGDGALASNSISQILQSARKAFLEHCGDKCSECGWEEIHSVTGLRPLHIDHIDGDHTNNHVSNLRVLCPNCHAQETVLR